MTKIDTLQQSILAWLTMQQRQPPKTLKDSANICIAINALTEAVNEEPVAQTEDFCAKLVDALAAMTLYMPQNVYSQEADAMQEVILCAVKNLSWLSENVPAATKPAIATLSLISRNNKNWHVRREALCDLDGLSGWQGELGDRAIDAIETQSSTNPDWVMRLNARTALYERAKDFGVAQQALLRSTECAMTMEPVPKLRELAYHTMSEIVRDFRLPEAELLQIGQRFSNAADERGQIPRLAAAGLAQVTARLIRDDAALGIAANGPVL